MLFLVIQEFPQSTDNVVRIHCDASGHTPGVRHPLVVRQGSDHLLCVACIDLVLNEAWFAVFPAAAWTEFRPINGYDVAQEGPPLFCDHIS